jgi:hypothetical protein
MSNPDVYYWMFIAIVVSGLITVAIANSGTAIRAGLTKVAEAIRDAGDKTAGPGVQTHKEEYVRLNFSIVTSAGPVSISAVKGDHKVTIQPTGNGAIITHEFRIRCESGILTRNVATNLKEQDKVTFIVDNTGTLLSFNVA